MCVLEKPFTSPLWVERGTSSALVAHQVYSCDACTQCFSTRGHLDRHWLLRHAERPQARFQCSYCSYSAKLKADVIRHEKSHTGEKPHSCHICAMSFIRREQVYIHLRTHTEERPYGCEHCGQRFKQRCHLVRHRKIHLGNAELYVCPHCGRGFARKDKLNIHLTVHTRELDFPPPPAVPPGGGGTVEEG